MTDRNDAWKGTANKSEKTQVITARVPRSIVERIDAIAATGEATRTAIVTRSLQRFVDEHTPPEPAGTSPSLFD